ncbi:hypothetical protein L2E82_34660 [Cichorium intybus]|uniref:Uncharacterized protein n=1 Tax=Cichorium intybus TaxID=13427 RepID=A0ACB9BMT3_CICIN|nr:hypothetical protein L2E82_34660 [Cichorium intybus]
MLSPFAKKVSIDFCRLPLSRLYCDNLEWKSVIGKHEIDVGHLRFRLSLTLRAGDDFPFIHMTEALYYLNLMG